MKFPIRAILTTLGVAIVLAVLLSMMPLSGFAQAVSGDLTGTVTDTTGAIINGATVEAVNVDTQFKKSATTVNGEYRLSNLPVGRYNLTVTAPNFAPTTLSNVPVELNKANNANAKLSVGMQATVVEVSGAAPMIDTTTAQITNTYDERLLTDTGVAATGSGVYNLALLSPGVTNGSAMGYGTGPSVGGQRPTNNNFTLEGVDNNDKSVTGPITSIPNDAVAEFSALQNQFSPEFGHSSGGQFNVVVNSGTNNFHGRAYEYMQNRDLNALDPALKLQGLTEVPRYDNNRFGGMFGGPIIKNKLFFYGLAEYNPVGTSSPAATPVCVPTAGGYSTLDAMPGLNATNLKVFESYTKSLATSASAACSSTTVNATTIPLATVSITPPSYSNTLNTVGSIDYDMSDRDQIRGRWIYNRYNGIDTSTLPAFFVPVPTRAHTVALSEYHTFNASLTNEFRAGFNRLAQEYAAPNASFPGLPAFPNLTWDDLNSLSLGGNGNYPQGGTQNTYQVTDSVSWVKGRHNFKFGGDIRHTIAPYSFTQYLRGNYDYSTLGLYLDDMSPDVVSLKGFLNGGKFYSNNSTFGFYANDNFRIRPNLSINLGLRYEYTTLPLGAAQQTLNAINNVPNLITFGKPQMPTTDFMPRIGFAYSPGTSGNTSIRGGFGISYDQYFDNLIQNALPQEFQFTTAGNLTTSTPNFLAGGGITSGSAPTSKANTSEWIPTTLKLPYSVNWNLGIQRVVGKVWTVSADYVGNHGVHLPLQERIDIFSPITATNSLPTYTSMPTAATLAGLATTLAQLQSQATFIVPAYKAAGFTSTGGITSEQPNGWSIYHGLALAVNRRLTNGLQVMSSYTWSHNIDNSDAMLNTTALNPRRPQDFVNLANEKANSLLDRRNRLVFSAVYDVPWFKNSNSLAKNVLGNWQLTPEYVIESGQPTTVQSGVDANLNNDSAADRVVFNAGGLPGMASAAMPVCLVGGVATAGSACKAATTLGYVGGVPGSTTVACTDASQCGQYIQAGKGAYATLGRNTLILPRTDNINLSIGKKVSITERMNVQFMAQAFNLFNHPQFVAGNINDVARGGPVALTGVRNFVLANGTNSSFDRADQVFSGNPRSMQLVLKLNF